MADDIRNFYEVTPAKYKHNYPNPFIREHGIAIPFMGLAVGGTGAGKSNFVMNLIEKVHDFETFPGGITILTKNADEPLYNGLREALPNVNIREVRASRSTREGWTLTNMPNLDEDFKTQEASLIIFDDLVGENKNALQCVSQFYIRARKKGASCLFLSQSYYETVPLIRRNIHYLFLLKLSSDRDLKTILAEYSIGVDRSMLAAMYEFATRERFHFLLIDIGKPPAKRYRHNFRRIFDIGS